MSWLSLAILVSAESPTWSLPAEGDSWSKLRSEHFTFISQVNEGETRQIAANLESFRNILARVAPALEPRSEKAILVFVFRDEASFSPYKVKLLENTGHEVAGFYSEGVDTDHILLKARLPGDPYAIVYHEFVHQVVNQHFTAVPRWLDEGLAEYYSSFTSDGKSLKVGRPVAAHRAWLHDHPRLSLQELFATDGTSRRYIDPELNKGFYATSWLLVHYLLNADPATPPRLPRLFAELAAGKSEEAAHIASIGLVYRELETALDAYVRQDNYPVRSWPLEGTSARADDVPEPLSRAELLYLLGDFLAAAGPEHHAAAEAHLAASIALAPESPDARVALSGLRLRQGRYDEASTLALEALDRGASGAMPLFRAALTLMPRALASELRAEKEVEVPRENVVRARDLLRRSLTIAPQSGEALAVLGWTYTVTDDDPGPGIEALEQALQLMPSRADVAWNLALLHLRAGNRERAAVLIEGPLSVLAPPEKLRIAQQQLALSELRAAEALVQAGKPAEGLERYRELAPRIQDPVLKPQLEQRSRELEQLFVKDREVAAYNHAIELARRDDLAGASAALTQLLESCTTPDLCAQAREFLGEIEARKRPQR